MTQSIFSDLCNWTLQQVIRTLSPELILQLQHTLRALADALPALQALSRGVKLDNQQEKAYGTLMTQSAKINIDVRTTRDIELSVEVELVGPSAPKRLFEAAESPDKK